MSAIEELRRLLDERGVEWEDASPVPSMKPWKTSFTSFTGEEVTIGAYDDPKWLMGTMVFLTPEQAIAATLGVGTCEKVRVHMPIEDEMHCSECGRFLGFAGDIGAPPYNFCPNCGRKVVSDG